MRLQKILGFALLGASTLLPVQALQPNVEGDFHEAELLGSRQTAKIPVTGVTGNGVQPRLEIRTLINEYPDMYNVFLLGLRRLMQVDQSDPLSYYQIAGIHGRPYSAWDGVGVAPGFGGGYCTHTSNLFLPWHRPYLALLEQQLYYHAQAVAQSYPAGPTKDKYVAAAENLRLPYWDWAAPICSICVAFPTALSNTYVTVTTPTGQQTIVNPLLRYEFHSVSVTDMVYNPFASWSVTKRYPTSWNTSASSQNGLLAPVIANNQANLRDRLYNLFTAYSNFSQFGDEAWISSSTTNADSLESVHDSIHSLVGQNGHMSYLDYAGFDPVFWLHHAMVDRSFALWQTLNPDSYVEPLKAVGATFTYPAGTANDVNSNLPPFYSDTLGTNWTSTRVRGTNTFGYTYPELANGASASSVRLAINKLYGSTASSSTVSKKSKGKRALTGANVTVSAAESTQNAASKNGSSYEYICNIVSQKFAMNGSYAVYVFLGNVSSNGSNFQNEPNLVGVHGVFSNLASEDNNMIDHDLKITGTVPLTTALIQKVLDGELGGLSPSVVGAYLTSNLNWKVAMMDGTYVALSEVPDLSVAVVQSEVVPAVREDDFPVWGRFTALVNVTSHKEGGYDRRYWDCPEDGTPYGSSYSGGYGSGSTATVSAAPFGNGTVATGVPQGTGAIGTGSAVASATSGPDSSPSPYAGSASTLCSSGPAIALGLAALFI